MENFLLFPQPEGVTWAVFAIAFVICWAPDKVEKVEDKLNVRRWRFLPILILLSLPLIFADWHDMWWFDVIRQVLGYLAVAVLGFITGVLFPRSGE
ncbi:MAG: hypothetical protein E7018_02460 [Alphaproteobacteria bacterium]|nr:hypothetical protein [Alphaproteobacteria bacterium]